MVPEEIPEMGVGGERGSGDRAEEGATSWGQPSEAVVGRRTDILLKSDRQAGNSPGPAGSI